MIYAGLMTRKKTIGDYSPDQLRAELLRRWAVEHFQNGQTMSQMELLVWETCGMENPAALRHLKALLERMPIEKPTGKLCPNCGRRAPVKAKDRQRTLRTMAGTVTLTRNYHYCERCTRGFYPVDLALDLPEEGELTHEMEKRVADFAVNDVYGQGAERWNVHYRLPISDNLLRRVAARLGRQCEEADQGHLQEALKPSAPPAEVLVIEPDGSLLPIIGAEPWKEAKVAVTYRHDVQRQRPVAGSHRYCAVVGTVANFAPVLEELLVAEHLDEVPSVVWLADGAPHNWTLADQLAPDALQVLDWYHAVEHAVACGRVLLDEDSPLLMLWKQRMEALLMTGDIEVLLGELMDCAGEVERRRGRTKAEALTAIDDLVRYYRANIARMKYRLFREHGLPIGSGAVESAHKHVLQCRMKRAGQRWRLPNARRMAHLRAAYRTAGAMAFYGAIQRARRDTQAVKARRKGRRQGFQFARQGSRDRLRARNAASN